MGIMIFMLKSQRRAFRWPNNLTTEYLLVITSMLPANKLEFIITMFWIMCCPMFCANCNHAKKKSFDFCHIF